MKLLSAARKTVEPYICFFAGGVAGRFGATLDGVRTRTNVNGVRGQRLRETGVSGYSKIQKQALTKVYGVRSRG